MGWSLSIAPGLVGPDLRSLSLTYKGEAGDGEGFGGKMRPKVTQILLRFPWANPWETRGHLQAAGPEPASPVSSWPLPHQGSGGEQEEASGLNRGRGGRLGRRLLAFTSRCGSEDKGATKGKKVPKLASREPGARKAPALPKPGSAKVKPGKLLPGRPCFRLLLH